MVVVLDVHARARLCVYKHIHNDRVRKKILEGVAYAVKLAGRPERHKDAIIGNL